MALTLNKLPWYGQIGIFVGISIAAFVGFYYLYATQMQEDMAQRQKKLDALQADIRKSQATARRLPQFRAEVAELETRLETLKNVLPEERDMGDLLRRLQTLAVQSNLSIRTFKPATPVTKQLHSEVPINLQVDGGYHNLGIFFDRVSKFPRIIHIGNINIRGKDRPDGASTITADFVATTFVLQDKAAATPAKGAAAPGKPAPPAGAKK